MSGNIFNQVDIYRTSSGTQSASQSNVGSNPTIAGMDSVASIQNPLSGAEDSLSGSARMPQNTQNKEA